MWDNAEDWDNFRSSITPEVELKSRSLTRLRRDETECLLVDVGPSWFLHVNNALKKISGSCLGARN
jgi:hypothetical protein